MTTTAAVAEGLGEELRNCRVLVVDDAEVSRRLIGAYLNAAGVRNIGYAGDGIEALEAAAAVRPDLVILDIMMPRMDGFEVCRRLRADARHRGLPILVETGLESSAERMEVFRAGATDLVSKPINGAELVARVRVHLENRLLVASLESFRERVQSELEMAREMQEALLPPPALLRDLGARHGLRLATHFQTSSELGGDHFGIDDLGDGRIGVFLVDFTGHGVKSALNAFRLHALMREHPLAGRAPSAYLAALNDRLADLLAADQFATMLYGVVDTAADSFTYAAAGAPSPVMGTPGAPTATLDGSGLPLGIVKGAGYADSTLAFPPGSFLCLYSDALTETADADGNMLAEAEVAALAAECAAAPAPLDALLARFRENRQPVRDDLTMIWVGRSAP